MNTLMVNIEHIKSTFTYADNCPTGIAALLSIIKFYNGDCPVSLLIEWSGSKNEKYVTLEELKRASVSAGFTVNIKLLTIDQLKRTHIPLILFFENELGEKDFVVSYGMYRERFIIGETSFGLMQYFPDEMEAMWIKGITLDLFPNIKFLDERKKGKQKTFITQLFKTQKR